MRAMMAREPGAPDVLQFAEIAIPEPGAGQVRLKVAYTGMNPLDAMLRREKLDWFPTPWPFIPGLEHSGIVDAVGEGGDSSLLGRRVLSRLGFGGYGDYSIVAAAGLVLLRDAMDMKTAATFRGCTSTAWYALHATARIAKGDTVLIHSAAGAVGAMAMQIARDAGARVCGLAGGPAKVAFARGYVGEGDHAVIDYLKPGWEEEARAFAGAGGFDVILDGNGGANAQKNWDLIGLLGRIVHVGATSGSPAPAVPPALLIAKSFSVGGIELRSVEAKLGYVGEKPILDAIVSGQWRVPISEVVPLEQVASLHARLENREIMGRAVIEVNGEMAA